MLKKLQILIFSAFLIITFITSCEKLTDPNIIPDETDFDDENYELVWSEEFDGNSRDLDTDTWNYETGYGSDGWGNDEWQNYTSDSTNVRIDNGNLIISAQCPSGQPAKRDGSVTSARITSKDKFSFKYGKITAKIKTPDGNGMWPAFWMMGQNFDSAGWPACGEIDIMEQSPLNYGTNTTLAALHWYDDSYENNHASDSDSYSFDYPLTDDFHIYEVEWDATRIVGKVDGIPLMIKALDPTLMSEFFNDFFLILNVAVGGNMGGTPDESTVWPQNMLVDWIRIYQQEAVEEDIETFGIFTDLTPVDAGLTVGLDADIWVWDTNGDGSGDLTLTGVTYPAYEGENVISFMSAGLGWFGAGIQSNLPIDLSDFAGGNINFMIKIPANVTFKIGINDTQEHASYVEFPADQTVFGYERNGEWGQAVIPISEIRGNVNLQSLSYEFIILEEYGAICQFAIDDIYWDGGGMPMESNVNFDAASYDISATNASVSVADEVAAGTMVSVAVDNGTDTINLDVTLDADGNGTAILNFGATDDATDTISITEGNILTATYIDAVSETRTDTADIISAGGTIGIYTESHDAQMLSYSQIVNSADWGGHGASPDEQSTAVTPLDGTYVLGVKFTEIGGADWSGIAFDFSSSLPDVSSYNTVIFNVNKVNMPILSHLGVKFEDDNGIQAELNISNYTPASNGQWDRYEIPLSDFAGVDFTQIKYFLFVNPSYGTNLLFGNLYFDDIYLDEEGSTPMESSVSFDAASYDVSATSSTISVVDEAAASTTVSVSIDNGTDTINLDVTLDADGNGTAILNFGTTDDATDTIAISEGDVLTATYIDAASETKTDTANIISSGGTIGIYTESHDAQMLVYSQIVNSADWGANGASPDVMSTAVTPVDGTYTLGVDFTDLGGAWSGIAFDYTNNPQDISSYNTLVLNINRSMMPTLTQLGVKFEDPVNTEELEVNLSNYTPENNGQWEKYNIPLADFSGVDLSNIEYFLIVNPMDSGSNLLFGDLHFDDIYLEQ